MIRKGEMRDEETMGRGRQTREDPNRTTMLVEVKTKRFGLKYVTSKKERESIIQLGPHSDVKKKVKGGKEGDDQVVESGEVFRGERLGRPARAERKSSNSGCVEEETKERQTGKKEGPWPRTNQEEGGNKKVLGPQSGGKSNTCLGRKEVSKKRNRSLRKKNCAVHPPLF